MDTEKVAKAEVIAIPAEFIYKYLAKTNPVYTNFYLSVCAFAGRGESVTSEKIARFLSLHNDVSEEALQYWLDRKLLSIGNGNEITIVSERNSDGGTESETKPIEVRPNFTPQELEVFKTTNEEVKSIIEYAEYIYGEPLKYSQINQLVGFADFYKLPCEVIKLLIKHCVDMGKYDLRYMEKVAIDWKKRCVLTVEQAQNRLDQFGMYARILNFMAMPSINGGTAAQKKCMDRWLNEYNFTIELIEDAIGRSSLATSKLSFNYVQKKLDAWHKAGVITLEDAAKAEEAIKDTKKKKQFNFQGREFCEEKAAEMMAKDKAYLERKMKEYDAGGE